MKKSDYRKYIQYIIGVGTRCRIEWFDDDWAPIGPQVRKDMKKLGLTKESKGYITRKK